MTSNIADVSDKDCRPIYNTTTNPSLKRNTSNHPVDKKGMEHSPHNQCSIQASKASTSKSLKGKKVNEGLDSPALSDAAEDSPESLETGIEHISIAMLYAAMSHLFPLSPIQAVQNGKISSRRQRKWCRCWCVPMHGIRPVRHWG